MFENLFISFDKIPQKIDTFLKKNNINFNDIIDDDTNDDDQKNKNTLKNIYTFLLNLGGSCKPTDSFTKKIKSKNLDNQNKQYIDKAEEELKNLIIIHYYCSYFLKYKKKKIIDNLTKFTNIIEYAELMFTYYFCKLFKSHQDDKSNSGQFESMDEKIGKLELSNHNSIYSSTLTKGARYYIKLEKINYNYKSPDEIFDYIRNYPKMVPINTITPRVSDYFQVNNTAVLSDDREDYDERFNPVYKLIKKNGGRTRHKKRRTKSKKSKKSKKKRSRKSRK